MNEHYWKPPTSCCRKGLMSGPVFDQYYVICFMFYVLCFMFYVDVM